MPMQTVLCVDDEEMVLNCLRSALERLGYGVLTTSDPLQAGDLLDRHRVDLLILDIHMARKDGFQVFKDIKARGAPLPVLFCTGYPGSFDMDSDERRDMWSRDFSDGLTDILYKPFTPDLLRAKVESLIGKPGENPE